MSLAYEGKEIPMRNKRTGEGNRHLLLWSAMFLMDLSGWNRNSEAYG